MFVLSKTETLHRKRYSKSLKLKFQNLNQGLHFSFIISRISVFTNSSSSMKLFAYFLILCIYKEAKNEKTKF